MHRLIEETEEKLYQKKICTMANKKSHKTKTLNRQRILTAINTVAQFVDVPEFGGRVGINRLSYIDTVRLTNGAQMHNEEDMQQAFLVDLLIACLCDEDGGRLFTEKDADFLSKMPATALQRLADVALKVNGLQDNATEQVVKN